MILFELILVIVAALFVDDAQTQDISSTTNTTGIWYVFLDADRDRMALYLDSDTDKPIKDCYFVGDKFLINATLIGIPNKNVTTVSSKVMDELIVDCMKDTETKNYTYTNISRLQSTFGILSTLLIFPGTKYCGAGNISTGWDDLGPERETDACCRGHDACPDDIDGGSSRYGLYNDSPFTASSCVCDYTLYTCLQKVDSASSNMVGELNFDIVRPKCFFNYYPIVGCSETYPYSDRCKKYEFNYTATPVWEFIDDPYYSPLSDVEKQEVQNITNHLEQISKNMSQHPPEFVFP